MKSLCKIKGVCAGFNTERDKFQRLIKMVGIMFPLIPEHIHDSSLNESSFSFFTSPTISKLLSDIIILYSLSFLQIQFYT